MGTPEPHSAADQAGQKFWDELWSRTKPPPVVDPRRPGPGNIFVRRLHGRLAEAIGPAAAGRSLLEVGCGRSAWLPYFNREFGLVVSGLDYSELGCRQARALLAAAGVDGEIVCADLFAPPPRMLDAFEFVFSAGVVEHFDDTAECLAACAALVRPGGAMITLLPNLAGSIGSLQRVLDRSIYDVHLPLADTDVRRAHEAAGLRVIDCRYFLSVGFGIARAPGDAGAAVAKRRLLRALELLSVGVWWLEDRVGRSLPTSRLLSPYVVCVAGRPGLISSAPMATSGRGEVEE